MAAAVSHIEDVLTLTPAEIAVALAALMRVNQNVAIIGPPGCGKTSIITQVCQEIGRPLIVSTPSVEDPTEPGGFPDLAKSKDYVRKVLFWHAYQAVNAKVPTNWHWEDFGTAVTSCQTAYMQWAWAREVSGHKLPKDLSITMATNRRNDKSGVQGVIETIKGRFTLIHWQTSVADFGANLYKRGVTEYGIDPDIIVSTMAFLNMRSVLLNAFSPTVDMTNSPTERNWVGAMQMRSLHLEEHIEKALVVGRIGRGAAFEYFAFEQIRKTLPPISDILKDPMNTPVYQGEDQMSVHYATACELARRCTLVNYDAIAKYTVRLGAVSPDVAALLTRDCDRICPDIKKTGAYADVVASPIGQYLTGRVA